MFTINGKFLTRDVNGQIRVAIETIKELDKIVPKNFIEIVAPESEFTLEGLNNIEIIRYGKGNAHIWEQLYLFYYAKKNNRILINMFNTHPFFKPDIAYVHDTLFSAYPNLYKTFYGRFQKLYTLLMIKTSVLWAKNIITVSDFTKKEIKKYYCNCKKNISVIYNGWQHMQKIKEDDEIFKKFKSIEHRKYLLAASGLTPQKNFKWVIENAKYNTDNMYVIVGAKEKSSQNENNSLKNVIYTGRVTDGELKALMKNCVAFIHPAIYEGFGMTPLEAVACGCEKLILANASCLPEIYMDSAFYIDPDNANIHIDEILKEYSNNTKKILNKYSWNEAAKKLYEILLKI